jgi:hypothetical protein
MKETPRSPTRISDSRTAAANAPPYTEAITSSTYIMPNTEHGLRRSADQWL